MVKRNFLQWLARVLIIAGHVTVLLGIYAYHRNRGQTTYLHILACVAFVALVSCLELRHRNFQAETKELKPEKVPTISSDDLWSLRQATIESRRVIVTLEHLVLDVTNYISQHPGGVHILKSVKNRDVTPFFYGG